VGQVVNEGEHDGVERGLDQKRGAWWERQQHTWNKEEEEHRSEERHERVKHCYTYGAGKD